MTEIIGHGILYECISCKGQYTSPQNGTPYYHICPEGTNFPRDESLVHDDAVDGGRPKNVRLKKGKARDKGGAKVVELE